MNSPVNGKIQGLFKAFECLFKYFSRHIRFSRTFQDSPVYSSTFQACANPVCKLFEPRSGQADQNCLTLIEFLKEFFKKVDFEKIQPIIKKHAKLTSMQKVKHFID